MIGFWRQLRFLLWKTLLVKSRQKAWLAVELMVPLLLISLLALIRLQDFTERSPACHYDAKGLPSAGILPFFHTLTCSTFNDCHEQPISGDDDVINKNTAVNNSFLVDVLYYTALQLKVIGESPQTASDIFWDTLDALGSLNIADLRSLDSVLLTDLLEMNQTELELLLASFNMTPNAVKSMAAASVDPFVLMIVIGKGDEIKSFSDCVRSNFFSVSSCTLSIPALCDVSQLERAFPMSPGRNLSREDVESICQLTPRSNTFNYVLQTNRILSGTRFRQMSHLAKAVQQLSSSQDWLRGQPILRLEKWKNRVNSESSLKELMMCGGDKIETLMEEQSPSTTVTKQMGETPAQRQLAKLDEFLNKVEIKEETTQKNVTCKNKVYTGRFCRLSSSQIVSELIKPLLQGYILVTPDTPPVRKLVGLLEQPLQALEILLSSILHYANASEEIQDKLNQSVWAQQWKAFTQLMEKNPRLEEMIGKERIDGLRPLIDMLFASPDDPTSLSAILKEVAGKMPDVGCFTFDRFRFVKDEMELEETATCLQDEHLYLTGLVFSNADHSFGPYTTYKIRHLGTFVDSTRTWQTSRWNNIKRDRAAVDLKYLTYGFSFLQDAVDRALIWSQTGHRPPRLGVYAQQHPSPCAVVNTFRVEHFLHLCIVLSFIAPSAILVKNIVLEKEQKLKEQMKIMGLGDSVHFISWALAAFAVNILSVLVIAALLTMAEILVRTDIIILILWLLLYAFSCIGLSLFVSTWSTNANKATGMCTAVIFICMFPAMYASQTRSRYYVLGTMLFPQSALVYASYHISRSDRTGAGISWQNILSQEDSPFDVTLAECMVALAIDGLLFFVLAWYTSAISPGSFGVAQSWYFPFTKKYWCPMACEEAQDALVRVIPDEDSDRFEPVPLTLRKTVTISQLAKVYDNGTVALSGLDLKLYENQITSLLGHNGAGKTTAMSMLCGVYPPTSGTAIIYGRDLRSDLRSVRDVLGFCPQQNVLFPRLTVHEQLRFFAGIKGTPINKLHTTADEILESINLVDKIFIRLGPQKEYKVQKKLRWWQRCCRRKTEEEENTENEEDDDAKEDKMEKLPESGTKSSVSSRHFDFELPELLTGGRRLAAHVKALLSVKRRYILRNIRLTFFQLILPLMVLLAAESYAYLVIPLQKKFITDPDGLPMVTRLAGKEPDSFIRLMQKKPSNLTYSLIESLLGDPGMGPLCTEAALPLNVPRVDLKCLNATEGVWNLTMDSPAVDLPICGCPDGNWNCTQEDYPLWEHQHVRLKTADRLWDMSNRDLNKMLMATTRTKNFSDGAVYFLGGFSMGHRNARALSLDEIRFAQQGWDWLAEILKTTNLTAPPVPTNNFTKGWSFYRAGREVLGVLDREDNVKIWFNNKFYASLPAYQNALANALLRLRLSPKIRQKFGILTIQQPMKAAEWEMVDSDTVTRLMLFRIILILLVLCTVPGGFSTFLVEERVSGSYHMQLVSGLSKKTYWLTTYVFDLSLCLLAGALVLVIFYSFQVKSFSHSQETLLSYLFLFSTYGLSAVLWSYILQRWFVISSLAFVVISIGTFFLGAVTTMLILILESLYDASPTMKTVHEVCRLAFLALPQYNLGMAISRGFVSDLIVSEENNNRLDLAKKLPIPHELDWDLMGMHVALLGAHFLLAGLILYFLEDRTFFCCQKLSDCCVSSEVKKAEEKAAAVEEDADVRLEKERVDAFQEKTADEQPPLLVRDLMKRYPKTGMAVRGVTFAVEAGECFGLLGLNGAGKTTCFNILTGNIYATGGTVAINNKEVEQGRMEAFSEVGYCPQFDALNVHLTTRENLVLYARIRGIPARHIRRLSDQLLKALHLRPYAKTVTGDLSGGNKRKLSVAIALISQPSLILLDEPSAGMDPGSQQFLWHVIEKLRKSGKAVVMTSHSMEECEALCTRIAIMDRGRVRCLGSKQHLKNMFGEGYSLTLKMTAGSEEEETQTAAVDDVVKRELATAQLEAVHCLTLFYKVPKKDVSIASIFKAVNRMKLKISLEDYSLSQATLGDVFYRLAKENEEAKSRQSSEEKEKEEG